MSKELLEFAENNHSFASHPEVNDMWLQIDCDDDDFELAVCSFVQRKLAERYTPFRKAEFHTCSCVY